MTPEEYQWHISLVRNRNYALNLTLEQAEKVYQYEQDKGTCSEKHYFSVWEEWDYELFSFKKILNAEQFAILENHLQGAIDNYRKSLIEQDNENLNEIEFNKEAIKYYEEQFLPDFFKDPLLFTFSWLSTDRTKIEFLKAEYKKYLNDSKMQILTNHFRHYRTYKPNELEVDLLHHKLSYLWPNYSFFKHQADEPTKAVAAYLKQKLRYFQEKYDDFLKEKLSALKIFNQANFDKYHSKKQGNWHTVIGQLSIEEEKENRVMSLLLLDKERYGCQHGCCQ